MSYSFQDNKYTKLYFNIIDKAKQQILADDILTECHHIIPRSLGGSDKKENLIKLTHRQHYICHMLLTKMVDDAYARFKLVHAFVAMSMNHSKLFNSKTYDIMRTAFHDVWSDPVFRNEQSAIRKKIWADPELLARCSEAAKAKWNDEKRKAFSLAIIRAWQNPDYQAIIKQSRLTMWQDSAFKAKLSKKQLEVWKRPKHRELMSSIREKLWQDQAFAEKQHESRCKSWTPERKAAHAEKIKLSAVRRKAAGLTSKPLTQEQKDKRRAGWTEERRNAARNKAIDKHNAKTVQEREEYAKACRDRYLNNQT